ncbi:MAG: hypothetical protein ACI3YQ_10195 [Prevotella sp.]
MWQPTVITVTEWLKPFGFVAYEVSVRSYISLLRYNPTPYIIGQFRTDNQWVRECRVPLSPTSSLHSPYIKPKKRRKSNNVGRM